MEHGIVVVEAVRNEMAGAPIWDFAVGEGQQVTVCASEYFWDRPIGPSPVRSVGPVTTFGTRGYQEEYKRCTTGWRDEFIAICRICLQRQRRALVTHDSVPDAEVVRALETFWSLFADLTKAAVAKRNLKKHLRQVRSSAPWLYVLGFYHETAASFFLSDDPATVDSAHELFTLLPDSLVMERW